MRELVFRHTDKRKTERFKITPRHAWGICYGMILRNMHARKIDGIEVYGMKVSGDHMLAHVGTPDGRTIHITADAGVYMVYGATWDDVTAPLSDDKLESLAMLACEYGPMNNDTLKRFLSCASDYEIPGTYVSEPVARRRGDIAYSVMFEGAQRSEYSYEAWHFAHKNPRKVDGNTWTTPLPAGVKQEELLGVHA